MYLYIIFFSLPLLGILVFWFLPLPWAILAYLVILLVSGLMYWVVARAMKRRPDYGSEGLIGAEARVVSVLGAHDDARYLVRVRGELWKAHSRDDLKPDDTVRVLAVSGLILTVKKIKTEQSQPQS